MDEHRFDQLSRAFATPGSRRRLTRLVLGLPLRGGVLALLTAAAPVAATPAPRQAQKRRRKKRHKRKPQPTSPPPTTPPCPACQRRDGAGQCVADPGQNRTDCAGSAGATSVCCNGSCCPGCCDGAGACGACRVFVTADPTFTGDLGGLAGAAATCLARALAGGLPGADLPGNYQAWLSDSTGSPSSRFRCTQASCSSQGYRLVNETKVADDWSDLTDESLDHAIDVTELNGAVPIPSNVWTHTLPDGTPGGAGNQHCQNWGSASFLERGDQGSAIDSDGFWTQGGETSCNAPGRLYCVQQR
jgi:hypothetical protein